MKILVDAHIPYLQNIAEQFGEVTYLPGNQFSKENIKDKDALIVRTVTHFDENILDGSKVKLICSATIGYDHIDTDYCDAHGIAWRTAPGCNANSVEQYITASLLILAHEYGFSLSEKTIGIVGVGNVGSKVEAACRKMGMKVLLNDPPRALLEGNDGFVDLETIKNQSDIITFHTPLTKTGEHKTYHLADADFFNSLGKKPIIINSCRGSVIDNKAWKNAINDKLISGSVIDCWENEPNIDLELLRLVDIATPHIAGYSADGKWTATKMSLQNLKDFFRMDIKDVHYDEIPAPLDPIIDLSGIPLEQQLLEAVQRTYFPKVDSDLLKAHPENFYKFRSNYPLRREYHAYKVVNCHKSVASLLLNLGFIVQ